MSRFVDGILVGLGIGLILAAASMYVLVAVSAAEIANARTETASQTGSQWVIVVKESDTTVTETGTVPSVGQFVKVPSIEEYTAGLVSTLQFIGILGAVFLFFGISTFLLERKTPTDKSNSTTR
jgi:hypothetical protein